MMFYDLPKLFAFLTQIHGITKVKWKQPDGIKYEKKNI